MKYLAINTQSEKQLRRSQRKQKKVQMPQFELGDPLNDDDQVDSKFDVSEQLCVSSSDKTKPDQKFKRFIECDTSSKYVKQKRQIKQGRKCLPSPKSDSKKSNSKQSFKQKSENQTKSTKNHQKLCMIRTILNRPKYTGSGNSASHFMTYVQNSENYKVTQLQKMWDRQQHCNSQIQGGKPYHPQKSNISSLLQVPKDNSGFNGAQNSFFDFATKENDFQVSFNHKNICDINEEEFQVFYKIEKINKKIWPAKSVLGKRFNQNINNFYNKFKVAKGNPKMAGTNLQPVCNQDKKQLVTQITEEPQKLVDQTKHDSFNRQYCDQIIQNNRSPCSEINDSNILQKETQIVENIVNLIQSLPNDNMLDNQALVLNEASIQEKGQNSVVVNDQDSILQQKAQQQKDENNTPSSETRDTQDCSPDLPSHTMMQPNGIGPESFDLIKEYLQSHQAQSSELQQLLASINYSATELDQPVDMGAAKRMISPSQQKTNQNSGIVPQCNIDDVDHNNHQQLKCIADKIESNNLTPSEHILNQFEFPMQNDNLSKLNIPIQEDAGLQDPEYQNKFNQRTVEIFEQTQNFMKTIVQFLQQLGPESQNVSSLLENLAALTGQECSDSDVGQGDVKNILKESLYNIQNQVHEHVLEYIMRFQLSSMSSEQQQCHQILQSLQSNPEIQALLSGNLAESN